MSSPPPALTPTQWDEARRLFAEALALAPDARAPWLASQAADAAVLDEVRSLLAWDAGADGFLDEPAVRVRDLAALPPAEPSLEGRSIGPWRVLSPIGRGGMGVVYHAERADDAFTRRAAVKVIGGDADAARVVERFRLERETLAALDHRNIARLLDGGTTEEGRPYLVMEFVAGMPVDRYCDERRLPLAARLELFRRICAGVEYAHQQLVVHRDIKPDNVLVTEDGTPKLLDFGVARILSRGAPQGDAAELAATWLMTPDFASPEQLAAAGGGPASDVYSLGVLLYVLLTGVRPYRLRGRSPAELSAQRAASVVAPPSARAREGPDADARAARRGLSAEHLFHRLSGDLDAIVLKAMATAPEERYSSVRALVDDLRAHLDRRPVSARAHTLGYLLGKYAARHRRGFLIGSIALGLVLGGSIAMVRQARIVAAERERAERRFDDVRRLANAFLFEVDDALADVPGTIPTRAIIVRTTSEYLESLAREAEGDLGLQRELARAWLRVGDVQGNPSGANLGDTAAALRSYEHALRFSDAVRAADPADVETLRTQAIAHRRIGDVLAWTGRPRDALREAETSARLFADLVARPAPAFEDRIDAVLGTLKHGDLLGNPNLPNLGRHAEAAADFTRALEGFSALDAERPGDLRVRRFLGVAWERVGTLHELEGRWLQAEDAYRRSFAIRRALADAEPTHRNIQRDLAIAYEKLGKVEAARGTGDGGIANLRLALATFERLAVADPGDVNAARTAAVSREVLGTALRAAARLPEARAYFDEALAAFEALAAGDVQNIQGRCDVARLAEAAGDAWAAGDGARRVTACDRYSAAQRGLDALPTAQGLSCATPETRARLAAKRRGCP